MPNHLKPDFFVELLMKFKDVHGSLYDYSRAEYKGVAKKIEIICSQHGSFWQTPKNHQLGQGCPSCCGTHKKSLETVVQEFKKTHGQKYDYSKVTYVNTDTPVEIVCAEHGSFWQKPTDHKRGRGCKQCGYASMRTPHIQLLERFNAVHNNWYDYNIDKPISNSAMVTIKCPIHEWFEQRVDHHLSGQGCPECNVNQYKRKRF